MMEGGGEEERAPDKRGGKGQPPLQLMPCSGGGGGEENIRKKRDLPGGGRRETWTNREKRERVSRYRGRKEQWPVERRGNCLAKAIQHKQENSPCVEAEGGWRTP